MTETSSDTTPSHPEPGARGPKLTIGAMLLMIAAVHQVVGVAMGLGLDPSVMFEGQPPLRAMIADGVFDSVGMDAWRNASTWFLLWGFLLAVLGLLSHEVERAGHRLSRSFAIAFGGLCVLGVILMPASGFWLGFVPAYVAHRRAPRG